MRRRTLPCASSNRRAPRCRQTLWKARGVPSSAPTTTNERPPISRTTYAPGSATAETWPTQIQPPMKMFSSSHPRTPSWRKAAGGSIVARSKGCRVASTSPPLTARRRPRSAPCIPSPFATPTPDLLVRGLIDLVVNRMIRSPSMTPERLDDATLDLQERARRFTDEVLIPLEVEAEMADGKLPDAAVERVRREALAAGLTGGLHAREHGGQGWTRLQWALVAEQFGRSTNAIHWHVPNAYNVWAHGSPDQIDRYLRPALRGELRDAYAVTEADAGSDPSRIKAVAEPHGDGGYLLSGEKWFVTSGDVASVLIVMA